MRSAATGILRFALGACVLAVISCASTSPKPDALAPLREEERLVTELTDAIRTMEGVESAEVVSGAEAGKQQLVIPVKAGDNADRASLESRIKAAALQTFPGASVRVIFIAPHASQGLP